MYYVINFKDVRELARRYTARDCAEKGLQMDTGEDDNKIILTPEAEEIFEVHLDLITNTLGIETRE